MKALFLDRDGIINVDHGYIYQKEKFQFMEGIFELLHLFIQDGFQLFIVTNQSGIGRNYYTLSDFNTLTSWMITEFKKQHIPIEHAYHCPHTPDDHCHCRKPKTGMIETCLNTYNIDLTRSWLIGDKQSDIDLAHNAHIGHTIAIGQRPIVNSSYHFDSILECKGFLEENQDTIL